MDQVDYLFLNLSDQGLGNLSSLAGKSDPDDPPVIRGLHAYYISCLSQ
jgi:hypothetical protein